MWRTFCQPDLDYACQLYSPGESNNLQNLESLLRTFTTWFPGVEGLDYWQRLSYLKINSVQRRFERYKVLYTWKILEQKVPNCGITWTNRCTTGRLCSTRTSTGRTNRIRRLRSESFQVVGPVIFNSLPPEIRDLSGCSNETFKLHLDRFLSVIPDCPRVPSGSPPPPMDPVTASPSNSVTHWVQYLGINTRRPGSYSLNGQNSILLSSTQQQIQTNIINC